MKFDIGELSSIDPDSISSVELSLYRFGGWGDYGGDPKYDQASNYSLHTAQTEWREDWDTEEAQWYWNKEENVTISDAIDVVGYEPKTTGWFTYDVTEEIKQMISGEMENNGFVVKCAVQGTIQSSGNQSGFYSSEYDEDLTLRPKLSVTYNQSEVSVVPQKKIELNSIRNSEQCRGTIRDLSGRVLREFSDLEYGNISSALNGLSRGRIFLVSIETVRGVTLTQKMTLP